MLMPQLDIAGKILKSNMGGCRRPYKLTFSVTDKCNSRCSGCGIWKKTPKDELTLDEITGFFKSNRFFNWIDVTGGEIFLRDDVEEILESSLAHSKKPYTLHYPTNGLLTERVIEVSRKIQEIAGCKLIVSVSLDGPPELHDRLRGVKGGFERAVSTFRGLREIGVESYMGFTLSGENQGMLQETIREASNRVAGVGPGDFHVNLAHQSSHYYGNEQPEFDAKKADDTISRFAVSRGIPLSPVLWLEKKFLGGLAEYAKTGRSPLPCTAASSSIFINPVGDIYPCSIWGMKIGSIRQEMNLTKILSSPKAKKLREKARCLDCPNCFTACDAYPTILGNLARVIP